MARALAGSPARVLVLERGKAVPQEADNWNPEAVWKHLRYRATERWLDGQGVEFLPYTHYGVGGNTKFWGSVLYRLRREDFGVHRARGRRLSGVAHRLRHACALLRTRRAAVSRPRAAGQRSDGAAARAVPLRARFRIRARHGRDSRRAAATGTASFAPAAGAHPPRRAGRLRAVQHLQLVSVQDPREERRRGLRHRAGARRPPTSSSGPTRGRGAWSPILRHESHRRRRRTRRRDRCTSARRSSSCRAVPSIRQRCCCDPRTAHIRTAWPIRRAWSDVATWPTWRR